MARILLLVLIFTQLGPMVISKTGPRPNLLWRDRAALISFASSVSRDPNGALASWGSSVIHVCNWTGISCNQGKQRVTQLALNATGLTGVISPTISNLSFLSVLDLSDNSFYGSIPTELGALSRLTELCLSSNLFHGSIPLELGLLHRLAYLTLGGNRLKGPIPRPLFCNTSLVYIDLSNNSLEGPIPLDMKCRLYDLKVLNLWSNELVGSIPSSLSNSSKLIWIDLTLNSLSGDIPPNVFDNMPYLQFIYLSYNNLSNHGVSNNLESFFASLANNSRSLQEIELAGNNFQGEIPSSIGYLSTKLIRLNLEENLLSGTIPPNITSLLNLTYMNLSNNLLNGSIPPYISQLKSLERLYLSNNMLSGEIPRSLGESPKLGLLDVSSNMLSGLIPDTLCNPSQLRRLLIHNNQLNGKIPSLENCKTLEILDLSHNQLTGRIPTDIFRLRSLNLYLNLSSNFLQGSLPLELSKLDMVLAIDLSSNNLSGTITPLLASCIALVYLNLSGNALQGSLPSFIGALPDLEILDLSSNQLVGAIPESLQASLTLNMMNLSYNNFSGAIKKEGFFANLSVNSFLNNPNLCGSISGMSACSRKNLHRLMILPVLLTLTVTYFLLCVIGYPLAMKLRRRALPLAFNQSVVDDQEEKNMDHPKISYRQLLETTRGFSESNLIGSGNFGHVYKGILPDHTRIAVKVLYSKNGGEISHSFHRECQVLKRTRHRNLIRIITICSKSDFKALVLPLMSNGSLESHLYPINAHSNGLNLVQLVSIMSDVAEGMAYLHHYAPVKVIHCDLKPSNVLLDKDMTALLSDFGIAKLIKGVTNERSDILNFSPLHSTTRLLCGSVGYIAPEYGLGGPPSIKGDVYSFGVLILEIITGKRPTDVIFHEGLTLHDWVKSHYHENIELIVKHDQLRNSPFMNMMCHKKLQRDALIELIELGLVCTQHYPSMRPIMTDVAHEIAIIKHDLLHHNIHTTESTITNTPPF